MMCEIHCRVATIVVILQYNSYSSQSHFKFVKTCITKINKAIDKHRPVKTRKCHFYTPYIDLKSVFDSVSHV